MTEPDAPLAADRPPAVAEPPTDAPIPEPSLTRPAPNVLPWLCGLGFLVLAGAIAFVWWSSQPLQPTPTTDLPALEARVAQLEQRPASPGGPVDLGPLTARIAAVEQRTSAALGPLEGRVDALDKQATDNSRFAARLDALSTRVDALSGRDQSADSDLAHRLDADETRLATLEHATAQMTGMTEHALRLARIQAAQTALEAGRPLGNLPDAPPAVTRFATADPPTEASLRLAYPRAERAALEAARPDMEGETFLSRVLARAEDLVTVRQSDRVLLGDPAAGALARARTALDAGDLTGAVVAVSSLPGPSAVAMAAWLADAKALLQARAGLADLAAHS